MGLGLRLQSTRHRQKFDYSHCFAWAARISAPRLLRDVATTLDKKYGGEKNKLVVGDHPQYMFNRFSDKQGLPPGEIPTDDKLADFAWTHSFDQVIFLLFTAPSVKSNEIALQWENAEVTLTARALTFKSRQKKKHSDVMTSQTVKTITRQAAKAAVFKKCIEALRDQMSIP